MSAGWGHCIQQHCVESLTFQNYLKDTIMINVSRSYNSDNHYCYIAIVLVVAIVIMLTLYIYLYTYFYNHVYIYTHRVLPLLSLLLRMFYNSITKPN